MSPPKWADWRPWPMLAGAVVCITSAVLLAENREATAEALLILGAILVGAWIVLLTIAGHTGEATTRVLRAEPRTQEEVHDDDTA